MPTPLQVDLLTSKVVSESHVAWATSVSILVFLGLSTLNLGLMYATDVRRTSLLNVPYPRGGGIISQWLQAIEDTVRRRVRHSTTQRLHGKLISKHVPLES